MGSADGLGRRAQTLLFYNSLLRDIFFYKHFLCVWSTNETADQVNEKQEEGIEIRPKFFSGQGTRSYNERNEMTMGSRVE